MLPQPDPDSIRLSETLCRQIADEIILAGGQISFERFMHQALNAPGLGYYAGPTLKFGESGDFVTAPGLGSVFGRCLARSIQDVIREIDAAEIVEFGAGDGRLAATILSELAIRDAVPARYRIVETSAQLRARQQEQLAHLPAGLLARVEWLHQLPTVVRGVVIGNELLDAMPCRRFEVGPGSELRELDVRITNPGDEVPAFGYFPGKPLEWSARQLGISVPVPGYRSELLTQAEAWVRTVGERIEEGLMVLADYGFPGQEFYHPDRSHGTLMCHYRHHSHTDPFWWPGLQDITTHVNFSAIARSAAEVSLKLIGYVDQASFLIDSGLTDILATSQQAHPAGSRESHALAAEIKKLTMPHEMGELFKIIAFSPQQSVPMYGFRRADRSSRLGG